MILSTGVNLEVLEVEFTEAQAAEGGKEKDHHLKIVVKNEFSNGNLEAGHRYIHVFGKYAKFLHDRNSVQVGGELTLSFETRKVSRVNKDTGKRDYIDEWVNPQNIICRMPKKDVTHNVVTDTGLDTETF